MRSPRINEARRLADPEANGAKSGGLAQAMERLFSTGKIKVETTSGPQSKRRERLVRV